MERGQSPVVYGADGAHLYPSPDNEPSPDDTQDAIIGFCQTEAIARNRCGDNPLKLRAVEVIDKISVRLSAEDTRQFLDADQHLHVTENWKRVGYLVK